MHEPQEKLLTRLRETNNPTTIHDVGMPEIEFRQSDQIRLDKWQTVRDDKYREHLRKDYIKTYKKDVVDITDDELWAHDTVLKARDTEIHEDKQFQDIIRELNALAISKTSKERKGILYRAIKGGMTSTKILTIELICHLEVRNRNIQTYLTVFSGINTTYINHNVFLWNNTCTSCYY